MKYLGCTGKVYEAFLAPLLALQPLSPTGEVMSFKNHGAWHIDHIRPISSFDFAEGDIDVYYQAFNYRNTQPLWAAANISKGNHFVESMHPLRWDTEKREWVKK